MLEISKIEFMRAGLLKYADAKETVGYFEASVSQALSDAFAAKTHWRNFQPLRTSEGDFESGKATGSVDRFIHAYIAGASQTRNGGKDKVWISIGLWWNPRSRPNCPVVAYSSAWVDGGGRPKLLDLPDRDKRVALGSVNRKNERCLLIEPREDFDPAEAFSLLLDAMDAALGADGA